MRRFIPFLLTLLLISGCGVPTKPISNNIAETPKPIVDPVPEPYKKGLEQLELNNWGQAIEYFDLTQKDFPKSSYTPKAVLYKLLIYRSFSRSDESISDALLNGAKGRAVFDTNEAKKMLEIGEKYVRDWQASAKRQSSLATYLYQNYDILVKDPKLELNSFSALDSYESTSRLEWLNNVGTYPTESDLNKINDTMINNYFCYYFKTVIGYSDKDIKDKWTTPLNGKIDSPALLWTIYLNLDNKELSKEVLNKVISVTANDRYNQYRLFAEKELKNGNNTK